MARGRKPNLIPRREKSIQLPIHLIELVDLALRDPLRDKPRYSAWSELIEKLLRQWLSSKGIDKC